MAVAAALVAAVAGAARADEDQEPARAPRETTDAPDGDLPQSESTEAEERSVIQTYYPPPVDGPALRLPESPTRLYVDAAYSDSKDLSALPYIAGSGTNLRFALGGVWRWRRFSFEAEVPFANVTSLDVTMVPGGVPTPEKQTGTAFGDVRLGAIWTTRLVGEALIAGVGYRTRLATHTTRFNFFLQTNGEEVSYVFPYYFHLEPTVIVGGALGRFTYVVNEGILGLIGPDGDFLGMHIVVPTVVFWDSHVAVSYAPFDFLGASVELGTDVQINDKGDNPQFPIENWRSLWLAPALQFHIGDWRIDAIARLGFGRKTEQFGVLEYIGTSSYTLRLTLAFN
ncbi:MAG TPA: hypothetical protein VHM31_00960 [Polyangia bacterium]|nr:hypothetical protein [Polyangia bacterium]